MIKTKIEYGNMIHPDRTIAKYTIHTCENMHEFEGFLIDLFAMNRSDIEISGNITMMKITQSEFVYWQEVLQGDGEE